VAKADIRRWEPAAPGSSASTESSPPMTLVKIAMIGVAIATLMFVARDQRWFERAGVAGSCYATSAPAGQSPGQGQDSWYACKEGLLSGFPNLAADACSPEQMIAHEELWRCDALLTSLPGE
jgi:hypothetical protein